MINGGALSGATGTINATNVSMSSGNLTAPSGGFNVSGNWVVNGGSFTPGNGTVNFTSSGTQTLSSGGNAFYNILHSGTGTLQLSSNSLTVTNNVNNPTGTFNLNGQNWNLGGVLTNPATIQLMPTPTLTRALTRRC